MFKICVRECIKEIVKDEISSIVSNPKCSISSSKISPNIIEEFFVLTINNKYTKSLLTL